MKKINDLRSINAGKADPEENSWDFRGFAHEFQTTLDSFISGVKEVASDITVEFDSWDKKGKTGFDFDFGFDGFKWNLGTNDKGGFSFDFSKVKRHAR